MIDDLYFTSSFFSHTYHFVLFLLLICTHRKSQNKNRALLDANPDKLIILKVFAPWCKACKGLAPKFQALTRDEKYNDLPMVWASLNIQNNKDFVKSIGVLALPTVQLYAGNGLKVDTFPCGPSKVPILKRKLVQLVNEHVDSKTRQLKPMADPVEGANTASVDTTATTANETLNAAAVAADGTTTTSTTKSVVPTKKSLSSVNATEAYPTATTDGGEAVMDVIEREKQMLRSGKYLVDLLESDFDKLLSKGHLLTFEAGSIVMREGNMGRTFYIILEGEVEICQRTSFEDPLTTPPSYLGTVINQFTNKGDYFGERSLITGEPRAASIRASSKTVCLAFDKSDFPNTSILSGFSDTALIDDVTKQREIDEINDKYGVAFNNNLQIKNDKTYNNTIEYSQQRGSVNTPNEIAGVDNDDKPVEAAARKRIVDDPSKIGVGTETLVPLLMRLKLIRSITRCFEYTQKYKLRFGDPGSRRRRNILLNVLSPMQRTYIEDAFRLIDEDQSELINLNEIKRVVNSVGDAKDIGLGSDDKISDLIEDNSTSSSSSSSSTPKTNFAPWRQQQDASTGTSVGRKVITKEDFFGLMAESETYQLFIDTFETLDPNDSGFVRAADLDRILCGVRDLISDDRKSIIDVDDMEMMVDYEQFSRMLLGTALKI